MREKTRIEGEVPVEGLYELAVREGNSKKPIYEIHKWWARRLGSVFRMLLLLATAPEQQTDDELWARFYKGDSLSHLRMLDPFMGGGTSVVEAAKLHFQTAGIDIDPVAWFITRQEVAPCDIEGINSELERLETSDIVSQIRRLYQTSLSRPRTEKYDGENQLEDADVIYNFWVDVLTCPHCHTSFEAHNHYKLLYHAEKSSQTAFCKACHQSTVLSISEQFLHCQHCAEVTEINNGPIKKGNFTCLACSYKGRIVDLPQSGSPLPKRWFAIEYLEPKTNRREFKVPDASDFARYVEAERLLETQLSVLPIPNREIPLLNREDPRPTTHGYAFYKQLFNARQLLTLGWLLQWISTIPNLEMRNYFVLAFSDALAANNLLCSFAYGYDKLTPLFGLHAYNMINRPVENNVWGTVFGRGSFKRCLRKVIEGKKYCADPYESRYKGGTGNLEKVFVSSPIAPHLVTASEDWYEQKDFQKAHCLLLNQSSEKLSGVRTGTIDIILTDPPYYNNLSYSELSDFYYAWIEPFLTETGAKWQASTTPYDKALFVKKRKQIRESISNFINGLLSVFTECHRVLQEHGLFIFTYHHLDAAAWVPLTQALLQTNFVITNVFPVRSEGRGQFHSTEGTIKWDAVIVCRKLERKKDVHDTGERFLKETDLSTVVFTPAIQAAFRWQKQLLSTELPFAWPDVLSLGYAFVLQHLTQLSSEQIRNLDINTLFSQFSTHIAKQLPEDAQLCIRKRKKHRVL